MGSNRGWERCSKSNGGIRILPFYFQGLGSSARFSEDESSLSELDSIGNY
ncbi:hypothetical protein A2U01_0082684, partial [Trifolium medium]|nr:hypothetical protein [Trifolium medium]